MPKNEQVQAPSLLFNKKYFERLSDKENRELYDHYHGIPGKMIYDIINKGAIMPLPTDPTEKSKVFFEVAAVKTVLGRYLYHIAVVLTDRNGAIFHVGLHKEDNAVKTVGDIASKKINKLKALIDWPSLEGVHENNVQKVTSASKSKCVPKNALTISLDTFNTQFPCIERSSDYPQTTTYVLPNKEELIFLQTSGVE